jgi:hypothetical protein
MNLTLISAAVAGALGFGSAWQIQSWKADANENNRLTEQANSQRELYVLGQKRSAVVNNAQNARVSREVSLRHHAVELRDVAGGLRIATRDVVRTATESPESCPVATAAIAAVFDQCVTEYSALAEIADRHVSDLQTINEAWPK